MKFLKTAGAIALAFGLLGAAAAQEIQTRTLRFGHVVNPGHPLSDGVKKFAEILSQRSGGKITVREFPSSTLGSEAQQMSAVQGGVQDLTMPSATTTSSAVKEFALLDMPFTFTTSDQVDALLGSRFGDMLMSKLQERGLVGLAFWEIGYRNFTNSRRPIVKPEDMQGLKTRVIGNPLSLDTFRALGANPVPMAFPELYGALETKAMDAQENPSSTILNSKFYEVQQYMSETRHVFTVNPVLLSKRVWDKLNAAEQKLIREAAQEAGVYQRRLSRESADAATKELAAKGMKVNTVPEATLAAMRDKTRDVANKYASSFDPEIVKLYREELARAQSGSR